MRDDRAQRGRFRVGHDGRADLAGLAVADTGDRNLFPRPSGPTSARSLACMLLAFPPTNVSSTSTGPANGAPSSAHVLRNRCARNHAERCVMFSSRWSFMLLMPLRFVVIR